MSNAQHPTPNAEGFLNHFEVRCSMLDVGRFAAAAFLIMTLHACGGGVPYGKVSFGNFESQGVVDRDYLQAQMTPLEPMFQACYSGALRRNHASEGIVRLTLTGGNGRLSATVVENGTRDEALGKCVTDAVASIPLVEKKEMPAWAFTADWSVNFAIARPKKRGVPGD
jgi:hypothetical protein